MKTILMEYVPKTLDTCVTTWTWGCFNPTHNSLGLEEIEKQRGLLNRKPCRPVLNSPFSGQGPHLIASASPLSMLPAPLAPGNDSPSGDSTLPGSSQKIQLQAKGKFSKLV